MFYYYSDKNGKTSRTIYVLKSPKMKLFVVSLERAKDRRLYITQHLDMMNVDYEIFDAVDGRQLTPSKIAEYCNMDMVNKYPDWLTEGAIGCCLSHYYIYKKIIDNNIPVACILEDDAIITAEFNNVLNAIEKNISKDTLTMLHYASWTELRLSRINAIEIGDYGFYEPEEIKKMNSSAGYIVTKEICERLVEILFPVSMSLDSWQQMFEAKAFSKIVCVYPRPVNTIHAKSTIDYLKTGSLLSKVAQLVDRHRIFPVYQLLRYKRIRFSKKMRRVTIVK